MNLRDTIKLILLNNKKSPLSVEDEIKKNYPYLAVDETNLYNKIVFIVENDESFYYDTINDYILLTEKTLILDNKIYKVNNYISIKKEKINYKFVLYYFLIAILLSFPFLFIIKSEFMFFFTFVLVLAHLIPLIPSYKIYNILKKKNKYLFFGKFLFILSILPTLGALYLWYEGNTCGSGCFSGLFFIISMLPACILFILNYLIFIFLPKYIYKY
ncbi:MAG: hypothetical protein ACNI25_08215 [Halarcobacter sp.]